MRSAGWSVGSRPAGEKSMRPVMGDGEEANATREERPRKREGE